MARQIFCRWREAEDVAVAGELPGTCATCGNIGRWSTLKHTGLLERRKHAKEPRHGFTINEEDRALLKDFGIAAD